MKDKHEAFDLHAINVERDTKKSNSHVWTCKYCLKTYTSGSTRLLQHLSKIRGQVAACKEIPQKIADEIRASMQQKASSRRASSPPLFYDKPSNVSSANASSIGGLGTGKCEASMSGSASGAGGKRQRANLNGHERTSRQTSLSQAPGHVGGSIAFLRERQKLAEVEIARTRIECNLSFNVLNNEQWKRMVRAIANVGPCDGWNGVTTRTCVQQK